MTQMKLHTVWGWWSGAEGPSLLLAWDEVDVDANCNGWREARQEAIDAADLSDLGTRDVVLTVDYEAVHRLFEAAELPAAVSS